MFLYLEMMVFLSISSFENVLLSQVSQQNNGALSSFENWVDFL